MDILVQSALSMSDRVSQLQLFVNGQAEFFCNAIGVLQACANPSKFDGLERVGAQPQDIDESVKDYPRNFARDIAACAKQIDSLIDALPTEDNTLDMQTKSFQRLEMENQDAAELLQEAIDRGQRLLDKIQAVIADIAQAVLDLDYDLSSVDVNESYPIEQLSEASSIESLPTE